MSSKVFVLRSLGIRDSLIEFIRELPIDESNPLAVKISELTRTLDQNAAQWPILEAISRQVQWPVNGQLCWLTSEEWKDILTAAFKGEQIRLAQGVNGGVVMLGLRTSKMGKKEFSAWLEFLHWFCAERGVALTRERVAS